jgi:hypothetical protein
LDITPRRTARNCFNDYADDQDSFKGGLLLKMSLVTMINDGVRRCGTSGAGTFHTEARKTLTTTTDDCATAGLVLREVWRRRRRPGTTLSTR